MTCLCHREITEFFSWKEKKVYGMKLQLLFPLWIFRIPKDFYWQETIHCRGVCFLKSVLGDLGEKWPVAGISSFHCAMQRSSQQNTCSLENFVLTLVLCCIHMSSHELCTWVEIKVKFKTEFQKPYTYYRNPLGLLCQCQLGTSCWPCQRPAKRKPTIWGQSFSLFALQFPHLKKMNGP